MYNYYIIHSDNYWCDFTLPEVSILNALLSGTWAISADCDWRTGKPRWRWHRFTDGAIEGTWGRQRFLTYHNISTLMFFVATSSYPWFMGISSFVNPGRLKLFHRRKELGVVMFTDHPTNSPGGYPLLQVESGKLLLMLQPMRSTFSRMGWMKIRPQNPLSGFLLWNLFSFSALFIFQFSVC